MQQSIKDMVKEMLSDHKVRKDKAVKVLQEIYGEKWKEVLRLKEVDEQQKEYDRKNN